MKFDLTVNLDNAAFSANPWALTDLLEYLAGRLSDRAPLPIGSSGPVSDINGNTVGFWSVTA